MWSLTSMDSLGAGVVFFFQAEDGIRDVAVTGVQTCALPICSHARIGPSGEPVLLLDQDRARWDWLLIGRGLAALARAERLGGTLGPYALQAAGRKSGV